MNKKKLKIYLTKNKQIIKETNKWIANLEIGYRQMVIFDTKLIIILILFFII